MSYAVCFKGVWKSYQERTLFKKKTVNALNGIDLQIDTGSIFAILGPNGAGKTTALNLLTGLLMPSQGQIEVLGEGLTAAVQRNIGYLAEEDILPENSSLKDLLYFSKKVFAISEPCFSSEIEFLRSYFDFSGFWKKPVKNLSAGQKRICGLICALIHRPQIIVLDEPAIYLDFAAVKSLSRMLSLFKQEQRTVIISSHILSQIEKLCTKVCVLKNGKVKFSGTAEMLASDIGLEQGFLKAMEE